MHAYVANNVSRTCNLAFSKNLVGFKTFPYQHRWNIELDGICKENGTWCESSSMEMLSVCGGGFTECFQNQSVLIVLHVKSTEVEGQFLGIRQITPKRFCHVVFNPLGHVKTGWTFSYVFNKEFGVLAVKLFDVGIIQCWRKRFNWWINMDRHQSVVRKGAIEYTAVVKLGMRATVKHIFVIWIFLGCTSVLVLFCEFVYCFRTGIKRNNINRLDNRIFIA